MMADWLRGYSRLGRGRVASRRVLAFIGFDTAGLPLVERLLEAGRAADAGGASAAGPLDAARTPGMQIEAGAYQTLYTRRAPGRARARLPVSAAARRTAPALHPLFSAHRPCWERLAAAGRRSLVVDPYEARLPERTAGVYLQRLAVREPVRASGPNGAAGRSPATRSPPRTPAARRGGVRAPEPLGLTELRRRLLAAPGRAARRGGRAR